MAVVGLPRHESTTNLAAPGRCRTGKRGAMGLVDGHSVTGYVKGVSMDEEGRTKLTFMIAPQHLVEATQIALLNKTLLYITVMRQIDVEKHFAAQLTGPPETL